MKKIVNYLFSVNVLGLFVGLFVMKFLSGNGTKFNRLLFFIFVFSALSGILSFVNLTDKKLRIICILFTLVELLFSWTFYWAAFETWGAWQT